MSEILRRVSLKERGDLPVEFRDRWLILWDGDCDFCRRSVQFVLRGERKKRFAESPAQHCEAWLPEAVIRASPYQFHLRSPEGLYWGGGAAVTKLLDAMDFPLLHWFLDLEPVRPIVAAAYHWCARHRVWLSRWVFREKQQG